MVDSETSITTGSLPVILGASPNLPKAVSYILKVTNGRISDYNVSD